MIQPDIYITKTDKELITEKNSPRQIMIPWLPDEIKFESNETRFASYNILDKGEIKIPTGANIHSYSWEGVLPGEGHKKHLSPVRGMAGSEKNPKYMELLA